MGSYRFRRLVAVVIVLLIAAVPVSQASLEMPTLKEIIGETSTDVPADVAMLEVKGRAPKTGYDRDQFGNGWNDIAGCDTRNSILARDLKDVVIDADCKVQRGTLVDPYTSKVVQFVRGETTSDDVQIDHVVAVSNAWQTGAQQISFERRVAFYNDPLNLLAVDGDINQAKGDGDAATWLPPNKSFRCEYVKRQIAVKRRYDLWVTAAERDAIVRVLAGCVN